jgi:hypothetical protein
MIHNIEQHTMGESLKAKMKKEFCFDAWDNEPGSD